VDLDRTTTAVDLAVQHAPNPAHGAGSSEAARLVRDLLAPVLGIGLDGPVIDVVDIGANPIDGDPPTAGCSTRGSADPAEPTPAGDASAMTRTVGIFGYLYPG